MWRSVNFTLYSYYHFINVFLCSRFIKIIHKNNSFMVITEKNISYILWKLCSSWQIYMCNEAIHINTHSSNFFI